MLNYVSESMKGYVAPTDTRWRMDQRLYEHGKIEEADVEKYNLEQQQWKRKFAERDKKVPPHQARYFRKVPHPFLNNKEIETNEEEPFHYELIDDENGYWQKRQRQDWSGSVNIWGPFEEESEKETKK